MATPLANSVSLSLLPSGRELSAVFFINDIQRDAVVLELPILISGCKNDINQLYAYCKLGNKCFNLERLHEPNSLSLMYRKSRAHLEVLPRNPSYFSPKLLKIKSLNTIYILHLVGRQNTASLLLLRILQCAFGLNSIPSDKSIRNI